MIELVEQENKGKLFVDATCTSIDVSYPTDLKMLNYGGEKFEEIIDLLHEPHKGGHKKVRTYLQKARKEYLNVDKKKRLLKQKIRSGIRKQLQYLSHNLRHIKN